MRRPRRTRAEATARLPHCPPTVRRPWAALGLWCLPGLLGLAMPLAQAQQQSFTLTPGFSATQLFTDNRDLTATNPQAESITTLSPSLRLAGRSARVQGSLDYTLNGSVYARESAANSVQHALRAGLNAELIDNHAFVAASASIAQQSVSALGLQGNRPSRINANNAEVRTVSLTPTVRGRLFGLVNVSAGLSSTLSSSGREAASDQASQVGTLTLGSAAGGPLGWTAALSSSRSDFEAGRQTTQDSATLQLSYAPDPGLSFFLRGGRESNDVQTLDGRSSDTWGAGVTWQPSPRTRLNLQGDRRYFGNSYTLGLNHRHKRSVWNYTDTRSVTGTPGNAGVSLSLYEIYFEQFASLEPDPTRRDLLVRDFLRAAGLDPNQRLTAGFIASALTLQTSRNLSFALQGRRTALVVSGFATRSSRADAASTAQDDLSRAGELRQQGWNVSISYRLSAGSSIVLSGTTQDTRTFAGTGDNDLSSLSLSYSGNFSSRAGFSLTARGARANGTNAYQENALQAALNVSF